MLKSKSLTELRGIAQSYGIADIFKLDQQRLIQEIEIKQQGMVKEPPISVPKPEYDARLMTKPPSKTSSEQDIIELLKPYVSRGMHITFPYPDTWEMVFGKKTDTGTTRQPLRNILKCAEKLTFTGVVRE